MKLRNVTLTLALVTAAFAALPVRAQSAVTAEGDPVARAMQRIETAVEWRISVADRVIAASKLLNESIAARKQGERERAEAALKQAETVIAEITPSQRSHLLDELAGAIAAERAALNPAPPEKPQTLFTNALPARRLTRNVAARYGTYQNTLARILAEEQVPVELLAVALVESGFNPQALSPKGARGIWQLMPATAARYGLTAGPLDDHRTHPEHSTRAAARYLRDLYRQFGDWKLALAAYNWGEGKVQRVIDKTGLRNFDELARRGLLPLETRNYVPAVLAVWSQLQQSQAKKEVRR
ncbi:MAG TPA: lytic transglycosylase domain-containing protein [Blastocatellia bacterium]|nr:lytic transglycosylase domain-containing protein [Blastocatellia bacterium]